MQYSVSTSQARAVLMQPYNDVDIFIEDVSSRRAIEKLIKNSLPQGIKFNSAISIGCRSAVIKEVSLNLASLRRQCYIIDADLDLLAFKSRRLPKNVVQLKKYCTENYFFNEKAIIKACLVFNQDTFIDQMERTIDYKSLLSNTKKMIKLYIAYAVGYRMGSSLTSIKTSPYTFSKVKGKCHDPCAKIIKEAVKSYIENLKLSYTLEKYRTNRSHVRRYSRRWQQDSIDAFSAKDLLFKMAFSWVKSRVKINCSEATFRGMCIEFSEAPIEMRIHKYFS